MSNPSEAAETVSESVALPQPEKAKENASTLRMQHLSSIAPREIGAVNESWGLSTGRKIRLMQRGHVVVASCHSVELLLLEISREDADKWQAALAGEFGDHTFEVQEVESTKTFEVVCTSV